MSATIKTPIGNATIQWGIWHSENKELEDYLNGVEDIGDPGGTDPNPDANVAERMIERMLDSTLIHADDTEEYNPNVVY